MDDGAPAERAPGAASPASPVRVLVTDSEERAVLAAIRGLDAAGYAVSAAASKFPAAGHWTRAASRRYRLPDPRTDAEDYLDRLEEILASGEHEVLIPGAEPSLLLVSEHRARFEPHARLGLPAHEVVLRNLDRHVLHEHAEAAGLGPPTSIRCEDEAAALEAARAFGYPVVAKPARSMFQGDVEMVQRASRVVNDEAALRELLPEYRTPLSIQRYETGPVVSCGGTFADGELLALAVSRYSRTWPAQGGSASLTVTIAPPPGLVERLEDLLCRLEWQGMFELELLELADGGLASIDFNPRPYGSMILAVESGANIPAAWCDWLLDRDPPAVHSWPGVRYRWEEAEFENFVARLADGRVRDALTVLRPYRGTAHALVGPLDPGPLAARLFFHLRRGARRRLRG